VLEEAKNRTTRCPGRWGVRVGTTSRADPSSLCRERASIVRLRAMTNLRLRAGDGATLSFRKREGSKEKSRVVWRVKHVASL